MRLLALIFLCFSLAVGTAGAASLEQIFGDAQAAYKAGQYVQSSTLFKQAAEMMLKAKEPAKAQMLLGNAAIAAMKGDDHQAAADIYESILKLPGKAPQEHLLKTYQNLIVCRSKLGQQALKIQAIEGMLKAVPKLPAPELVNAYAQLGDAYRALELYAAAVSAYGKAAHMQPQGTPPAVTARLLTAMGLCQGNLGDFTKAADSLNKASALAQQAGEALTIAEAASNLGILHWERADYGQASGLLHKALDTEKQHALLRNEGVDRNNLGLVEKSAGRIQPAMEYFEAALDIARKVGNKRDEAIALSNRALLNRMTGNLQQARADYREALKLYDEVGFKEGRAGALLGIGKMVELEDRNLEVALNNYNEALEIYTALSMPRNQAEALLQVGGIHKRAIAPGRTTRDLVFDDAPVPPKQSREESLATAQEAYTKALQLAETVNSKEMIWAARQGLGYLLMQQSKLEEAFAQYSQAIQTVGALRTSLKSVSLLGEYMAGKEDLYGEGMELCALLYEKTKQQKYITQQMEWDETLRNEVQKASAALVQMEFGDKKKQAVYDSLMQTARRLEKAEGAIPVVQTLPANATQEAKAQQKLKAEAAKSQKAEVQKLEGDYAKLLSQWKKDYPADAVMFESAARVDIPKVQKALKSDQVLLQYVPLQEKLLIVAISQTKVDTYSVNVGITEIESTIKNDFLINYVESYRDRLNLVQEQEGLRIAHKVFSKFYEWFIDPARQSLTDKKRIYVAANGFIAQVPFTALVSGGEELKPRFLIDDYEISNIRPSFITNLIAEKQKVSTKKVLAVGDPRNKYLRRGLKPLPASEAEVKALFATLQLEGKQHYTEPQFKESATEQWWNEEILKNKYEMLYFSTHGMPFSDTYYSYYVQYKNTVRPQKVKEAAQGNSDAQKTIDVWDGQMEFIKKSLPGFSPLNGYLFMQATDSTDGLLTMKEIYELPESAFATTKFVVLSACNTAVTFAPKSLQSEEFSEKLNSKEVENDLRKVGWVPGADQVSFTDVFMRRDVNNVYGTLWFADDTASTYIMSNAIKSIYMDSKDQDVVSGYTTTLRNYLAEARKDEGFLKKGIKVASNPYYWACGAIFGK